MNSISQEGRIFIAIEALRFDKTLSYAKAAILYNVPRTTLRRRINGRHARNDPSLITTKLRKLEEEVILNNIIDLDSRGFAPRLSSVEEIANLILASRGGNRVKKN